MDLLTVTQHVVTHQYVSLDNVYYPLPMTSELTFCIGGIYRTYLKTIFQLALRLTNKRCAQSLKYVQTFGEMGIRGRDQIKLSLYIVVIGISSVPSISK